ncbi:hypothetical protein Ancab_025657 [Ancistrocladus abbreviatus]
MHPITDRRGKRSNEASHKCLFNGPDKDTSTSNTLTCYDPGRTVIIYRLSTQEYSIDLHNN